MSLAANGSTPEPKFSLVDTLSPELNVSPYNGKSHAMERLVCVLCLEIGLYEDEIAFDEISKSQIKYTDHHGDEDSSALAVLSEGVC